MIKVISVFFTVLLLIVAGTAASKTSHNVNEKSLKDIIRLEILDAGIYKAVRQKKIKNPNSPQSHYSHVVEINLTEKTRIIPAKIGTAFGFRYKLSSQGLHDKVKLTTVINFPTPGIKNPDSGEVFLVEEYSEIKSINGTRFCAYSLSKDWEVVSGAWRFRIYYKDELLADEKFTVK